MTIKELIDKVARLKPHAYATDEIIGWLTRLEGRIFADIILTHDNPENINFTGYDSGMDEAEQEATTLIVREPHDNLYLYYIMSQIDLHNLEYDKYNNSVQQFNTAYKDFDLFWHRNRRPVQTVLYFNI